MNKEKIICPRCNRQCEAYRLKDQKTLFTEEVNLERVRRVYIIQSHYRSYTDKRQCSYSYKQCYDLKQIINE